MRIAPDAINILEILSSKNENIKLTEIWSEIKQTVQEENNRISTQFQFPPDDLSRENFVNSKSKSKHQVRFSYD